jgi:hypothetical protein
MPHARLSVPDADLRPRVWSVAVEEPRVMYFPVAWVSVKSPDTKPTRLVETVMVAVMPVYSWVAMPYRSSRWFLTTAINGDALLLGVPRHTDAWVQYDAVHESAGLFLHD